MNDWNFSKQNQKLFEELKNINNSVEKRLHETFLQINQYDSSLLKHWIDEGLKPKIDSYLLRYVIPFYESLIQEKKENVADALIIQLLSCVSWRTFDNCIDTRNGFLGFLIDKDTFNCSGACCSLLSQRCVAEEYTDHNELD